MLWAETNFDSACGVCAGVAARLFPVFQGSKAAGTQAIGLFALDRAVLCLVLVASKTLFSHSRL